MYNPMSLENKTILVTGGGSGIGRETAIEICRLGGHVCLLDVNEAGMNETLSCCSEKSEGIQIDLMETETIKSCFNECVQHMGPFHGLVHCAGIPSIIPLKMLNFENYHRVMNINTLAAIELIKCFANRKNCTGEGASIVLISSVYGIVGSACNVAYAASKSAIIGVTKSLAIELAPRKIRVNCVAPGFIQTNMAESVETKFDSSYCENVEALHPLGWGEPADIAHGITYLLSDAAKWMTGTVMNIDGGYTAQ